MTPPSRPETSADAPGSASMESHENRTSSRANMRRRSRKILATRRRKNAGARFGGSRGRIAAFSPGRMSIRAQSPLDRSGKRRFVGPRGADWLASRRRLVHLVVHCTSLSERIGPCRKWSVSPMRGSAGDAPEDQTDPTLDEGGLSMSNNAPRMRESRLSARAGSIKISASTRKWSGRRESNPRMQLGKLPFYH